MENYELLLEKAFGGLKPVVFSKGCDRFEIPKADSRVIGNKTVLNNFMHICSCFRRAPEHLCKFLSIELSAFSRILQRVQKTRYRTYKARRAFFHTLPCMRSKAQLRKGVVSISQIINSLGALIFYVNYSERPKYPPIVFCSLEYIN